MLGEHRTLDAVFEGMLQQRLRLKTNLRLVEWLGMWLTLPFEILMAQLTQFQA